MDSVAEGPVSMPCLSINSTHDELDQSILTRQDVLVPILIFIFLPLPILSAVKKLTLLLL